MKTNYELIEYVKKAYDEKWGYLWGEWGRTLTDDLLKNNFYQYPQNRSKTTYLSKYQKNKDRVTDCYGLVKGFLWQDNDYKPRASQDRNTLMAYTAAAKKGSSHYGDIKNMPEIPGIILYMAGHVGIYAGNGVFYECRGDYGMDKGRIENNIIVKGSKFSRWFKDIEISYVEKPKSEIAKQEVLQEELQTKLESQGNITPNPTHEIKIISIQVEEGDDNFSIEVNSILNNGYNYPNLRQLMGQLGYRVTYDTNEGKIKLRKL